MDIGGKIKGLRLMHGLTMEDLADRTELSKGFISQLERNLTSPSIATLVDILACLGTDLKEFFSDSAGAPVVFDGEDAFEKEDDEAGFKVAWAGWVDPKTHAGNPIARAGDDEGYLDKIEVYADDRPEGRGPVGTCIREDKTIILWDVDLDSWRERACQIAGRNLTRAEWGQYLGDEPYRKTCEQWPSPDF